MKIVLCGACGRMGRAVAEFCAERGIEIVCGVDLAPAPMPFPVLADISQWNEPADCVVDFSSAQGLSERLTRCLAQKTAIVTAVTGLSAEDEDLIEAASREIPVFKTGNTSLGVSLLCLLAEKAAAVLKDFDAEIVEKHHNQKKDAPSGTALMLAKSVEKGFGGGMTEVYGRKGMVGARPKREIGIHAVRGGNIVGEHEIVFAGEDEIVTLAHSARSRKIFASGALRAAAWLISQPAGLYDMNDLLEGLLSR